MNTIPFNNNAFSVKKNGLEVNVSSFDFVFFNLVIKSLSELKFKVFRLGHMMFWSINSLTEDNAKKIVSVIWLLYSLV